MFWHCCVSIPFHRHRRNHKRVQTREAKILERPDNNKDADDVFKSEVWYNHATHFQIKEFRNWDVNNDCRCTMHVYINLQTGGWSLNYNSCLRNIRQSSLLHFWHQFLENSGGGASLGGCRLLLPLVSSEFVSIRVLYGRLIYFTICK